MSEKKEIATQTPFRYQKDDYVIVKQLKEMEKEE